MSEETGGVGTPTPMSERMQALLSRAVEDQLSEQRQLAGLLGEIRDRLARLPQEVSAAAGAGPDPQLQALLASVDGVAAGLRELRGRVDALPAFPTERLEGRVDATGRGLSDRLDALTARLEALEQTVRDTTAQSEKRLAAHIDEAVLALAEAILRRRRGTAARREDADIAPTPEPEPAEDVEPSTPEPTAPEPATAPPTEPPWQPAEWTPAAGVPPGEPDPEDERRKRPWWRPAE